MKCERAAAAAGVFLEMLLVGCGGSVIAEAPDAGFDGEGGGAMVGANSTGGSWSEGGSDGPTSGSSSSSGSGSGSSGGSASGGDGGSDSGTSGGSASGGETSSGGSNAFDGSPGTGDSSVQYDAARPGLAGFAFVINGTVQQPLSCPSANWEFAPFPSAAVCSGSPPNACPGVMSVLLVNRGQRPMAFIAATFLDASGGYVPGVPTGDPNQIAGVLSPGEQVDYTAIYNGGITALVGSADPFSEPDAGKYAGDEGTVPWPAGVAGSGGGAQMQVAEIEVRTSCGVTTKVW